MSSFKETLSFYFLLFRYKIGGMLVKWYQLDVESIADELNVAINEGLKGSEIKKRQRKYGLNELQADEQVSKWLLFLKQFQDFMVLVLLAATLIAGLLGEYIDAIAIMIIVFIN